MQPVFKMMMKTKKKTGKKLCYKSALQYKHVNEEICEKNKRFKTLPEGLGY